MIFSGWSWQRSKQCWQKVWKQGSTLGETKVPLHTGHFVFELVKLPPPRGDEERPEEELAEPVLALSREDADDVAEETPEEDPSAEKPWEKESSPWSLEASPHRARAPLRESMEGVGDVISPDFCLTIPSSFVVLS